MRSLAQLGLPLLLASLVGGLAPTSMGCAADREVVDSSEQHETVSSELAVARDVVALLGGDKGRCSQCHGINASQIREWGTTMIALDATCLGNEEFDPNGPAAGLSSKERVDCLRRVSGDPTSPFSAGRLGLYAAGVGGSELKDLFEDAFPGSATQYAEFTRKAGMPKSGEPLTSDEFDKMKAWVFRGMRGLDEAFGATPAPACTPSATPELAAHVAAMKTGGWGAHLADQGTPMFGCAPGAAAMSCLGGLPDATAAFGAGDVVQGLRELHKQPLASHYWVRSSADGRYVGYGLEDGSKIVDLTKPGGPGIAVAAAYDPYFLPSNDGFAFAGAFAGGEKGKGGSMVLCRQSLLNDVATAAKPFVSMSEEKCSGIGDDVYMSIGTALDGARYFMTVGSHENDDGGHDQTTPLPAAFGFSARTMFTPMVNDGLKYRPQPQVKVALPNEGDMMLSPSSMLAATRFGDGETSRGFRIRFVRPEQVDGKLNLTMPLAAEICMPGQKANFSFDERFVATHQYVDSKDPAMAGLAEGSANIMVADLATGKQLRITASKSGVFALYPHFRADGWLYFAVRDMNARVEYIVASDIALRMSE